VQSLCACLAHTWGTLAVLLSECTSNNNTTLLKESQNCGSFITLATSAKIWERPRILKLRWSQGYHILFNCPQSAD